MNLDWGPNNNRLQRQQQTSEAATDARGSNRLHTILKLKLRMLRKCHSQRKQHQRDDDTTKVTLVIKTLSCTDERERNIETATEAPPCCQQWNHRGWRLTYIRGLKLSKLSPCPDSCAERFCLDSRIPEIGFFPTLLFSTLLMKYKPASGFNCDLSLYDLQYYKLGAKQRRFSAVKKHIRCEEFDEVSLYAVHTVN